MDSVFLKPVIATAAYFQPTTGENTMVQNHTGCQCPTQQQRQNDIMCSHYIHYMLGNAQNMGCSFLKISSDWGTMPPSPAHHHHHPLSFLALTSATAKSSSWWLLFFAGISSPSRGQLMNQASSRCSFRNSYTPPEVKQFPPEKLPKPNRKCSLPTTIFKVLW